MARQILSIRGKVLLAKLYINAAEGRVVWRDGDCWTEEFERYLKTFQTFFGIVPKDGVLDQKTMDLIVYLGTAQAPRLVHDNGARIPFGHGGIALEVHLGIKPHAQTNAAQLAIHRTILPGDHPHRPAIYNEASEPAVPWGYGAFGLTDPEDEQWYCGALWPYASARTQERFGGPPPQGPGQSAYRGLRVRVFNERTGKAVICTPGEYGPNKRTTGFIAGVSPDVMFALGGRHGDTCRLSWAPDDTPLGPAAPIR